MSRRIAQSIAWTSVALLLACAGCEQRAAGSPPATIAASNSQLESAVRAILGNEARILRLAEPGMCPGHFDLRPSQVEALRQCRLLLRFDFQSALDRKIEPIAKTGLRIVGVRVPGGLCEPDSYASVCKQVADALVAQRLCPRNIADQRLAALCTQLETETAWARQKIHDAGLIDCPVVASQHQAAFCRYLGLKVLATFTGTDTASIEELDTAIAAGEPARFIIANVPEGRRLADALATRLGAKVVVFGNFPDVEHHHAQFETLFRDNVQQLIDAAAQ